MNLRCLFWDTSLNTLSCYLQWRVEPRRSSSAKGGAQSAVPWSDVISTVSGKQFLHVKALGWICRCKGHRSQWSLCQVSGVYELNVRNSILSSSFTHMTRPRDGQCEHSTISLQFHRIVVQCGALISLIQCTTVYSFYGCCRSVSLFVQKPCHAWRCEWYETAIFSRPLDSDGERPTGAVLLRIWCQWPAGALGVLWHPQEPRARWIPLCWFPCLVAGHLGTRLWWAKSGPRPQGDLAQGQAQSGILLRDEEGHGSGPGHSSAGSMGHNCQVATLQTLAALCALGRRVFQVDGWARGQRWGLGQVWFTSQRRVYGACGEGRHQGPCWAEGWTRDASLRVASCLYFQLQGCSSDCSTSPHHPGRLEGPTPGALLDALASWVGRFWWSWLCLLHWAAFHVRSHEGLRGLGHSQPFPTSSWSVWTDHLEVVDGNSILASRSGFLVHWNIHRILGQKWARSSVPIYIHLQWHQVSGCRWFWANKT